MNSKLLYILWKSVLSQVIWYHFVWYVSMLGWTGGIVCEILKIISNFLGVNFWGAHTVYIPDPISSTPPRKDSFEKCCQLLPIFAFYSNEYTKKL